MSDLADGESAEVAGSSGAKYVLKNVGGVYSCSCPAWRNQSVSIDKRTCKHLRNFRSDAAEQQRLGGILAPAAKLPIKPPANVPPLLLAEKWDQEQDLKGWFLSEKLDGVRAYWDGKQFLSRQGNRFFAPDWFTRSFPDTPLDGELWIDRKFFQQTVSVVRRQVGGDAWRAVKYVVFDAPSFDGPFEARLRELTRLLVPKRSLFAQVLEQTPCYGTDHLHRELARIESLGGEGLMLRQPGSQYEAGRSSTLLKVKTFHDAEALVIEHLPGAGKHKGRLGALRVALADGTQFSVGTGFSDSQRENPPTVGSVITFRFQELTNGGVPRFPSFVRVRRDGSAATPLLR